MDFVDDQSRFDFLRTTCYSGVLCDSMDAVGLHDQAMAARIRPVSGDMVVVGRARTARWAEVHQRRDNPYAKEIELLDSLKPNEVSVHDVPPGARGGPWGELLSTAASMRGSTGVVLDGLVRDTRQILEMGFPVFCTGFRPTDSAGRTELISYDEPVCCGGVVVRNGDVVFGDIDGVVVIPADAVDEVLNVAHEKVTSENNTRRELLEGKLLKEVYDKYGVL